MRPRSDQRRTVTAPASWKAAAAARPPPGWLARAVIRANAVSTELAFSGSRPRTRAAAVSMGLLLLLLTPPEHADTFKELSSDQRCVHLLPPSEFGIIRVRDYRFLENDVRRHRPKQSGNCMRAVGICRAVRTSKPQLIAIAMTNN